MRFMNNLSIAKRLVVLVSIALAAVIAIVLTGMANNRRLAEEIHLGYEAITRPLAAVGNAHGAFNAMRTALYDLAHDFNTTEQNNLFKEQVMQSLNNYESNIVLYKAILDIYGTNDPYEQEAVAYLYGQLAPLRGYVEHIVSIAEKTGREADAVRILRGDFLNAAEDISFDLMRLTEILEAQTYEENLKASQMYENSSKIYVFATVLSALILISAAYLIVVSITRPLKEMTSVAESLAKGRIDIEITHRSTNEMGVLADSFRNLTRSVSGIIGDMRTMAQKQSEGDIEYYIGTGGYQGSYLDMVTGINEMMSTAVSDIETIVNYLQSLLGAGNAQIERFPGKKGVISDTIDKLADKVHYDMLTGIYNRRYMEETLNRIVKAMQRSCGGVISILMLDIDYFKRFNDTYGHAAGDDCLRKIAKVIESSITREADFAARYGGEEFIVVLPNTNENGARIMAERILAHVRECNITHANNDAADYVTLSIGVFTGDVQESLNVTEYIKRADEALYLSKENGKNMYTFFSSEHTEEGRVDPQHSHENAFGRI